MPMPVRKMQGRMLSEKATEVSADGSGRNSHTAKKCKEFCRTTLKSLGVEVHKNTEECKSAVQTWERRLKQCVEANGGNSEM